jgi:2',3'-cyclic-nucleotide 2'-phosphodiesterase/3'-nucleotidase
MFKRVAALLLIASACAPASVAPGSTAAVAPSRGPICEGSSARVFDTTAVVPDVPGATRLTFFFATHTHGDLIRADRVSFAHYAGALRRLREALPDPAKSLFVGNGDDVSWSLCGVPTEGQHVVDAFNAGGLDANTFGFNEVAPDDSRISPAQLRRLVQMSRFTWLSANVRELDGKDVFAAAQGARRWVVKELGGVRVGLTGLIVPSPAAGYTPASYGRDLAVIDPVEAMREILPLMRRDGAQIIVVLSHMDIDAMERVAREVEGIDAILGSHAWQPSAIKLVGKTILADGHNNMHQIGQLDLLVKDGQVAAHAFSLHAVSLSSTKHADVAAVLERYVPSR